jgi:hypothetical protein
MKIQALTSGYAFTGDPIIAMSDTGDTSGGYERYVVTVGGETVYEGCLSVPFRVNIAEIVAAKTDYFREPAGTDVLELLESDLSQRRVSFACEDGGGHLSHPLDFIAIPGRVGLKTYKALSAVNTDAFTLRFLSPRCNRLLTVKSRSWIIPVRESELCPLLMILAGQTDIEIRPTTFPAALPWTSDGVSPGVYALSPEALRRWFFDNDDIIASQFDLYTEGVFSCRIVIERAEPAFRRYRLKFRNRLGAFEIMELTSAITIGLPDDDDDTYSRYDPLIDDFSLVNDRRAPRRNMTADLKLRRDGDIAALDDMLESDEVYLLDAAGSPLRVTVTTEAELPMLPLAPMTVTLTLTASDAGPLAPLLTDTGKEYSRGDVFTDPFNDIFN